jgi:hypothetical protein
MPLQSPCPAEHEATVHVAATQPGVPFAAVHAMLQPPQLAGSLFGSMHDVGGVPHAICGATHEARQLPDEHTSPPVHAMPGLLPVPVLEQSPVAPQCAMLVLGSTHAPPHITKLAGHVAAHAPATQCVPDAHAWLHEPQFASSVCKLTHEVPHSIELVGHPVMHVPALQD